MRYWNKMTAAVWVVVGGGMLAAQQAAAQKRAASAPDTAAIRAAYQRAGVEYEARKKAAIDGDPAVQEARKRLSDAQQAVADFLKSRGLTMSEGAAETIRAMPEFKPLQAALDQAIVQEKSVVSEAAERVVRENLQLRTLQELRNDFAEQMGAGRGFGR